MFVAWSSSSLLQFVLLVICTSRLITAAAVTVGRVPRQGEHLLIKGKTHTQTSSVAFIGRVVRVKNWQQQQLEERRTAAPIFGVFAAPIFVREREIGCVSMLIMTLFEPCRFVFGTC